MKKELFAGVLLLVLIGLCAWNLRYLSRMCTQLDEAVAQAEASCAAGDPARASETLRAASARWSEAEDYAHCMLPHESTDAVTEGFRGRSARWRPAIRPPRRTSPFCACAFRGSPTGSASRSATFFSRGR